MNRPSVLDFSDYRDYLVAMVEFQQAQNPHWTYGVWARQMQLSSKSLLTMVVKGERMPSKSFIIKCARYFGWTKEEQVHFTRLAEGQRQRRRALYRAIVVHTPEGDSNRPHWLKFLLTELSAEPSFKPTRENFFRRTGLDAPQADLDEAWSMLVTEGLVQGSDGPVKRQELKPWTPMEIARFHHDTLEVLSKNLFSLTREERHFQASFLRMRAERMPEAKAFMQELLGRFSERFDEPEGDEVFQLAAFYAPLTRGGQK